MLALAADTAWSLNPLQLAPIAVIGFMYGRRARTLARRGTPVPRWRQWLFWTGIALLLVALASPVDTLGEEDFLFMHMLQHVLLGDLAPLAIVAGLTGPMLRPVLAIPVVDRLRVLAHPLVALPLWALSLYVWHVPALYEAALDNSAVHALEHVCFFTFGALMWAPGASRCCRRRSGSAPAQSSATSPSVRVVETILGNVFLWTSGPFYDTYVHARSGGSALRATRTSPAS